MKISLLCSFLLFVSTSVLSIQVEPDGGYSGIVIKISQDVPEEKCHQILQKIQVRLFNYLMQWGWGMQNQKVKQWIAILAPSI